MLFKRKPRDWVGLWYKIAREDRGVNDLFTFMKIDAARGEILEYHDLSHEHMDGLGALTWLLRREGNNIPEVPEGRCNPAPRGLALLRLVRDFRKVSKNMSVNWVGGQPPKKASLREIAWEVLTEPETSMILARAKQDGLSMNSVLLGTLNNVVSPKLVRGNDPFLWLFPVNMRGPVKLHSPIWNASSAVGIECRKGVGFIEIHSQIREQMKKNIHWATWWTVNIGRLFGERVMRWLSAYRANGNFWMGTFSNLGAWPLPGMTLEASHADHVWVPSPPGTVNFPIGFACTIWNGKLAMTLKMHPSICADFEQVKGFLTQTRADLLSYARVATGKFASRPEAASIALNGSLS